MSTASQLLFDRRQRPAHSFGYRASPQDEAFVLPRLPANVREAKKVERLAASPSFPLASSRRYAAELDQAGLLGMKRQAKLLQPFLQCVEACFCVHFRLESDHEIVRITHHDALPFTVTCSPLIDPQVEHVVQEDVRK